MDVEALGGSCASTPFRRPPVDQFPSIGAVTQCRRGSVRWGIIEESGEGFIEQGQHRRGDGVLMGHNDRAMTADRGDACDKVRHAMCDLAEGFLGEGQISWVREVGIKFTWDKAW